MGQGSLYRDITTFSLCLPYGGTSQKKKPTFSTHRAPTGVRPPAIHWVLESPSRSMAACAEESK